MDCFSDRSLGFQKMLDSLAEAVVVLWTSEGPKSSDDGGFSKYVVDDSSAAVNNNPNVKLHAELVNNTGSLKSEAQLGFVHSKEDGEDEEQFPDL